LVLIVLFCFGAISAQALTITINGETLTAGPGQNTIDLQGTYGVPQPGLATGLEIAPSSPGVVPTLSFTDTPTFKSLTMTNFALVGPQSTNPFFYPFNAYSITIENVFTPFPITGLAGATLGMSGNYVPSFAFFTIGGDVVGSAAINGQQITGNGFNTAVVPISAPIFLSGVSTLSFNPIDDVCLIADCTAPVPVIDAGNQQFSCDNALGNPPDFACFVQQIIGITSTGALDVQLQLNVDFVDPDQFVFPGSFDFSLTVPEPTSMMLLWTGLVCLVLGCRRKKVMSSSSPFLIRNPHYDAATMALTLPRLMLRADEVRHFMVGDIEVTPKGAPEWPIVTRWRQNAPST
jgi:hypothetical protein